MSTSFNKKPMRIIEVPLAKFTEEVIPHYKTLFGKHKTTVNKLVSERNCVELKREINNQRKCIKQLKDLMYELDTLRTQVEDCDLDKFDNNTLSVRKTILTLVTGYNEFSKISQELINSENSDTENVEDLLEETHQIQLMNNLDDLILKQHEEQYRKYEELNENINDIHEIFDNLNEMVVDQKENVNKIENNVDNANENVSGGLKYIKIASKFKAATYPITGAVLGSLIGGPIGLLAGAKIGGIAALVCGVAGYTGGKVIKKCNGNSDGVTSSEIKDVFVDSSNLGDTDKKDI